MCAGYAPVRIGAMSVTEESVSASRQRTRHLGPLGTSARLVVGAWLLFHAAEHGVGPADVLLGLVVPNAVVFGVLAARGACAPPLRMHGPLAHVANVAIAFVLLQFVHVPGLLFTGTASLLAAARSYGGCEMFALWNWLRRRDDQFACPFFLPCDVVDHLVTGRERPC